MAYYNEMSDSDRRREERRQYENDVFYDVWRSGRDTDRINYERVEDHYWRGDSAEAAASHEIRVQRQAEERRMEERDGAGIRTPAIRGIHGLARTAGPKGAAFLC